MTSNEISQQSEVDIKLSSENGSLQQLTDLLGFKIGGWTNGVIAYEALKAGYKVHKPDGRRSFVISNGSRSLTFWNGSTNWNHRLARRVARYKDVTSKLLAAQGVATTQNQVFQGHEAERAWSWARDFDSIVVKPVDGSQGQGVHLDIQSHEEFERAFQEVCRIADGRALVEEFYDGIEHRCLMVNGEFIAATRRRPANVVGDGLSTVAQLVQKKNQSRNEIHKKIQVDNTALRILAGEGLGLNSILEAGHRVYLRTASNIHQGGDAIDATQDISRSEVDFLEDAVRSVPGARLVGLDVLISRDSGGAEGTRVLEFNTGPMISMHHFPQEGEPRNVARAILEARFNR